MYNDVPTGSKRGPASYGSAQKPDRGSDTTLRDLISLMISRLKENLCFTIPE